MPSPVSAEAQPVDDQALALHLSRAGEHLRHDRLSEASTEIDTALRLSPRDLRARNLLGLLHFRAGRFEDALLVYRQLLGERGSDTALRLNLGLVELRIGHHREAVEHLACVVEAEPDNNRAQGYYGLALMRAGELHRARQVLSAAGQDELVEQVDELLNAQRAEEEPAVPEPAPPDRTAPASPAARRDERGSRPPPLPAAVRAQAVSMPPVASGPAGPQASRAPARVQPRVQAVSGPSFLPEAGELALDREGQRTLSEARRAAAAGERALDADQPFAPAEISSEPAGEGRKGDEGWQVRPASEGLPLPAPSSRSPLRPIPVPQERTMPAAISTPGTQPALALSAFLRGREIGPPGDGAPFGITTEGLLVVRIASQLPTRSVGVVVSTGDLNFGPLQRRARGRSLQEPFGEGAFGMFQATGNGMMVISPRGGHFMVLGLRDESIYLRESITFGFDGGLHWENGRLPGSGPAPAYGYAGLPDVLGRVVQFRGTGQVVVRTDRPLFTVRLQSGQTGFIEVEQLVGWVGKIIPSLLLEEGGGPTPYVECSGEGFLVVEPPPREGNLGQAPAGGPGGPE